MLQTRRPSGVIYHYIELATGKVLSDLSTAILATILYVSTTSFIPDQARETIIMVQRILHICEVALFEMLFTSPVLYKSCLHGAVPRSLGSILNYGFFPFEDKHRSYAEDAGQLWRAHYAAGSQNLHRTRYISRAKARQKIRSFRTISNGTL